MSQAVDPHAETAPADGMSRSAPMIALLVGVLLCAGTALAVRVIAGAASLPT